MELCSSRMSSLAVKRDALTPALSTQCWQGFADLQLDMLIDGMLR